MTVDGSPVASTVRAAEPGTPVDVSVVGADGFIGGWLTAVLRDSGLNIARFTRHRPPAQHARSLSGLRQSQTVFYLATSINMAIAEQHPELVRADARAFESLLDSLSGLGHRPRVVLTSSGGAVYDPSAAPPYREDDVPGPTSAYGKAKLAMERQLCRRAGDVQPAILRLANVYGPGQRLGTGQGVIGHWLDAVERGKPITVFGQSRSVRDYVYVADVATAMLAVHRWDGTGSEPLVLNVGSGVGTSLADLLDVLRGVVTDRPVRVVRLPGRPFDDRRSWLDVDRARRLLAWRPTTGLAAGIEASWRHRRSTPDAGRVPAGPAAPPLALGRPPHVYEP
jgi:UDP-glucose 4-epimerase